jgi:vesicle-fusing ATPase
MEDVINNYVNQMVAVGQVLAMDFEGIKVELTIARLDFLSEKALTYGQITGPTEIRFKKGGSKLVKLSGSRVSGGSGGGGTSIFLGDFDFEKLGIGGLDKEFNKIFRRAFASRIWPQHIIKQMGINHVRGMLLYGPPGCGKTLIARQIGKILNAREPKIVNGPEILNKFVGGSEEKIRELFAEAEKEQAEEGDQSMLHIIILDEMDAIAKKRGSTNNGTGVQDSVVNQLLSKIDGVDSLNNILLIGMTNRKDMIDDALLRPGRLELHVEIGLPDKKGRSQILNIHTKSMQESNRISEEALKGLDMIAEKTKNFSGAEIEGLIKAASSFALTRCVDIKYLSKPPDESKLQLTLKDLETALDDVDAKFGAKNQELKSLYRNGFVPYGENFDFLMNTLDRLVEQVRSSEKTPIMSVLLRGPTACGKTAIAAKVAVESGYPFVRMISADEMIGMSEMGKCAMIHEAFMDAYKSPLSLIFIDDIERIIDYVAIGPRFSNTVLQTLLVLLKKSPPTEGRRLLCIGTTSVPHVLDDLGLTQAFSVSQSVNLLQEPNEITEVLQHAAHVPNEEAFNIARSIKRPIAIKHLLMVAEMARQASSSGHVSANVFLECLHTVGY